MLRRFFFGECFLVFGGDFVGVVGKLCCFEFFVLSFVGFWLRFFGVYELEVGFSGDVFL